MHSCQGEEQQGKHSCQGEEQRGKHSCQGVEQRSCPGVDQQGHSCQGVKQQSCPGVEQRNRTETEPQVEVVVTPSQLLSKYKLCGRCGAFYQTLKQHRGDCHPVSADQRE
jgi:hypothetical protein